MRGPFAKNGERAAALRAGQSPSGVRPLSQRARGVHTHTCSFAHEALTCSLAHEALTCSDDAALAVVEAGGVLGGAAGLGLRCLASQLAAGLGPSPLPSSRLPDAGGAEEAGAGWLSRHRCSFSMRAFSCVCACSTRWAR